MLATILIIIGVLLMIVRGTGLFVVAARPNVDLRKLREQYIKDHR